MNFRRIWKVPARWKGMARQIGDEAEEIVAPHLEHENRMESWLRFDSGEEEYILSVGIGEDGKPEINMPNAG